MNRRGFLQAILAAGVAPAVVGSGVLMPVRAVLKAPELVVGDQFTIEGVVASRGGNVLLTVSAITQEALRILERELVDAAFLVSPAWDPAEGLIVHTRRPARFAA